MYKKRLSGIVIATITPMNEDGSIDEKSLQNYTEYLVKSGVNCLYPNGTNGESLLLTKDEREHIAQTMFEINQQRKPLFIQCGSMSTHETSSHVQHALKIGADGVGIMSPVFFPVDDKAMFDYYSEALTNLPSDFPVYVYNIPGCTTSDVKPELLESLMQVFPNVAGIKYSCQDLIRVEAYLALKTRKPDLLIGCDSLILQCLLTGGTGTVSGPGAVFHERFSRLYCQYQEGDYEGAVKTQQQIVAADQKMAGIPGIPALKAMLKMRGVIKNDTCRAPLRKLAKEEYKILDEVMENYYLEEKINE